MSSGLSKTELFGLPKNRNRRNPLT